MRKRTLLIAVLVLAIVAVGATIVVATPRGPSEGLVAAPTEALVPGTDAAVSEGMPSELGVQAIVTQQASALDAASVTSLVRSKSAGLAAQAESISVHHVILTARYVDGPLSGSDIAPRSLPVWMVTLHGITDYPAGGVRAAGSSEPPVAVTDMNFTIFVDDNGNYIMAEEYLPVK